MNKPLFNDFEEVSAKAWKLKIQFDLKGADYNDTLVWESREGIHVKPFYHKDHQNNITSYFPNNENSWQIGQEIYVNHIDKSLNNSIDYVERGADVLNYKIPNENIELYNILNSKDLNASNYLCDFEFLSSIYINKLVGALNISKTYLNLDILGNLARTGNWYKSLKEDHNILEDVLSNHSEKFAGILSVDMGLYQNAGANSVQQLAYGLAHVNEYLNHFKTIGKSILFKVSIGSNYFFEIAKLRALRKLWSALISEYDLDCKLIISAQPSKRNKTIYDYNSNMLRTTTECMSAVLGGADIVTNLSYDTLFRKHNEFGSRLSRNQLLILKHESYFDKISNPSEGSYYIEDLTEKLGQKSLQLFKEVENNGGFFKHLKEGVIQRKAKESANQEQEEFNNSTEILIGTNKYANESDRMKNELQLYPFVKTKPRKTLIEPIIEKRLSENIEKERLDLEQS